MLKNFVIAGLLALLVEEIKATRRSNARVDLLFSLLHKHAVPLTEADLQKLSEHKVI